MRHSSRLLRAAALAALGGCTGTIIDGGSAKDAPVQVDVAARCAAPHGMPSAPATASSFARAIAGRWLVCHADPSSSSVLLTHDGIEFSLDGQWSLLKADTLGGYEHTVNAGTFGTYALLVQENNRQVPPTDTTPTGGVTLRLDGASLELRLEFEVSPKRLLTLPRAAPTAIAFVRLDNEADEPLPYTSKEGELCSATTPCRAPLACSPTTLANDGGVSSICVRAP